MKYTNMSDINLSSVSYEEQKKGHYSQSALVGVFATMILVLVAWGGLTAYKIFYLEKSIAKAKSAYEISKAQLSGDEAKKVIDFQRRLEVSGTLVVQGRSMWDDMTQIESLMVPNSYLSSYEYDDKSKTITLGCTGDNFNTMAKQILSFKNSPYFSEVTAGTSAIDTQNGKITFPVELKIK